MKYDFRCRKCGKKIVVDHPMAEEHPKTHKGCGGELSRDFFTTSVIYRTGGFVTTDKRLDPKDPALDFD